MPVRILHAHSTFSLGGKEARAVQLMNAWGDAAHHSVLSGMPDQLGAREAIAPGIRVNFPKNAPSLTGHFGLARLFRLSRYMREFDLVLTYNWGAFDAVMAKYLFRGPPLVHHEDGFNEDEANGLKPSRNLYRRLGLSGAHRLVVPSRRLEEIARTAWAQGEERVTRIPNGIPLDSFSEKPATDAIPGLVPREGELIVGTVAGLRKVKNLPRLVRAFATVGQPARLVIVGEGPEKGAILAEAARLGVAERVHLPGFLPNPARYMGLFDIFALSSDSEQFPISLLEAMAAGLPAASTAVGDVPHMVAKENAGLIVPVENEQALGDALGRLAGDAGLRQRLGRANRAKARDEYDESAMIRAYADLYSEAIGRTGAFPYQL
ncbi:MAG TPA: glycosyltransferase family 4 protein [Allosphingosinicella sp.]|jgi:glycosyltransferase involved in cell wall biosynthesis|uniref:glycosyltransferase family 4 protein n=1 Tax=Allosphingosinicella sp. TaxID=2823234 RepID=UPI002F28D021